jgi:hypothetical protein
LAELSDADLAAWFTRTALGAAQARRFTLRRLRWRRAHSRAGRAFAARILEHAAISGVCEHCQQRPPITHVASGEGAALCFHHYCHSCAPSAVVGWFGISTSTR